MKTTLQTIGNMNKTFKCFSCFVVAILLCLLVNKQATAEVSISSFTNPNWCGTYPTAYTTVGNFSIAEVTIANTDGFTRNQTNGTLVLGFSNASFEFNPGVGTISVNNTGVTINSYTITATAITLDITTLAFNTDFNTILFSGIQIRATAVASGRLQRTGGTFRIDNSTTQPAGSISWGNLTSSAPFAFSTSTITQTSTANVAPVLTNQRIIRIAIAVTGTCNPLTATSFTLSTSGSTNPSTDIANAKLYYTTNTTFSSANLFGTAASPNGTFTITGSRVLPTVGTHYFWLTYDMTAAPTNGNVVDAQSIDVTLNGSTIAIAGNPVGSRTVSSAVYYSRAAGNFSTTSNWSTIAVGGASCTCVPVDGSSVVIGHALTLNVTRSLTNVTIQAGGSLAPSTGVLTVTNLLSTSNNGSFNVSGATLNDVTTSGTGSSTIASLPSFTGDLTIGSGTTVNISGNTNLSGSLTNNGTLAIGANTLTLSGSGSGLAGGSLTPTITTGNFTGSGTISIITDKNIPSNSNLSISPVIAIASGVTVTNQGTVKTTNDITGGNSASAWINDISSSLEMAGTTSTLLATGTLNASATPNTVIYSGTGAQLIESGTYYDLNITQATKTLSNAITINRNLTLSGDAVVDASASNYSISIAGDWINNSTATNPFVYRTGTVTFNGTTVVSGSAISAFNTINIASGGNLTAHATPGSFRVSGNWTNNGNFFSNSSDVTFIAAGVPGGSATSTMSGASITAFNNLIINSSKTVTFPSTEMDINGNFTNNGTIVDNNGLVAFKGVGTTQTFGGTTSSNTLSSVEIFNAGGQLDLINPLTVNGTLYLTDGIITTPSSSLLLNSPNIIAPNSASYVSGMLKRVFTSATSLYFPIGKGGNPRPLTFTYVSLTGTSTVSVEQTESALTGTLPGASVLNNSRTWDISQTGGSAFTYKLTLDGTGDIISGPVVILKKESGSITANLAIDAYPQYTNTANYNSLSGTCNFTTGSNCSVSSDAGTDLGGVDNSLCGLTTVTLGAAIPPSGTGTWSVISGTGGSFGNASANNSTFNGTSGESYLLKWTVSDGGCSAGSDLNVVFDQNPSTANAGVFQTICTSTSTTLTANIPTIGSGSWSFISGPNTNLSQLSSLTANNATFTPAGGVGTYRLRWTIANSPCNNSVSSVNITVVSSVTPTITISTASNTVCSGTSVTFTASATGGGAGPLYQWTKNGTNITGANSITYVATAGTNFVNGDIIRCVLTSNASCRTATNVTSSGITMTVNPLVTPSIVISVPSSTVCSGTSVTFTSSITNGGSSPSYQWKKNTINIPSATSSTYTTSSLATSDVITCVLTSNAICPSPSATPTSNSITITVNTSGVWLGTTNSNWSTTTNWCGSAVPISSTNVDISTGVPFQPQLSASSLCNNLSLGTGATLTLNGQNLTVSGAFSGAGTIVGSTTSSITITGTGNAGTFNMSQASESSKTLSNLTLNRTSSGSVTLGDNLNISTDLTLSNGTLNTAGKLRLLSTASKTASIGQVTGTGNISGNVIAEKFAPGGSTGWANIGNPVNNDLISSWQDDFPTSGFDGATGTASGFISVYSYNEAVSGTYTNGYTAATNATNTVAIGKGYMVYMGTGATTTSAITIDATGPVQIGDFNLPVTYTPSVPTALPSEDGWNLIANPYCSTIDWDNANWIKTNVGTAIQYYNADAQNYAVYVAGSAGVGTNGATNLIAASQSFWLKASAASPVLTAKETVKSTANVTLMRSTATLPNGFMKISVNNSIGSDEAILRLDPNATTNFDDNFDALKLYSFNETVPNIATIMNGITYSINAFDNVNSVPEIPFEFKAGSLGTCTMAFEGVSGFAQGMYLKDNQLQSVTPLNGDTTLALNVQNISAELNRYSIVFNNVVTKASSFPLNNSINIYPNPAKETLNVDFSLKNVDLKVLIVDMLGNEIINENLRNQHTALNIQNLSSGVYFVKVINGNECVGVKKWIKE